MSVHQIAPEASPDGRQQHPLPKKSVKTSWITTSDRQLYVSVGILLIIVLAGLLAPWLTPHGPTDQEIADRLLPPIGFEGWNSQYLLGTDSLGRDIFTRVLHGSRVSLVVGLATVALSAGIGVAAGMTAAYVGGRVDAFIMRTSDALVTFPGLLFAMLVLYIIGPSMTSLIVVFALTSWMVFTRLSRTLVRSALEEGYVEAAILSGCRHGRLMTVHILPNLVAPLSTLALLEFARIVLAEATMSYLGLGVQPPDVSWGLMVSEGKDYMMSAWWLVTIPGLAIAVTVLALNMVGSGLQVRMNPIERDKQIARAMIRHTTRVKESTR